MVKHLVSFQVFCNHLAEEKRACDFTLTVFFICVLKFVLLSLPRGDVGWSVVSESGISRLFLAVPWVCLQFVIVVFPDNTNLLFYAQFI